MKFNCQGCAYLRSKIDPRWDYDVSDIFVGGFCMPDELQKKIEEFEKLYGPNPEDLEYGYHKY